MFGKIKGEKLTDAEIVAEAKASEAAEKKAKKEGKAIPELSKQRKKLKKDYETNNWRVFDIDPAYVILRSGDKYAVITPARFSAKEIAQDFKAKFPGTKPVEVSSGMAMNTRYVVFTAPEIEGKVAEPIASKRTRGLQRLATERFDKAVLEIRNEIGKSTYKDLANGTTIDRLVEKFGLERTVRALMDEAATRESQREKVGEFMMDDRVLGKAMEYLKGTYGVVVQFSLARDNVSRSSVEKDVLIYNRGAFIPSNTKGEPPRASVNFTEIVPSEGLYEQFYEDFSEFPKGSMDGAVFVHSFNVYNERSKGLGKKLLNATLAWADQNQKPIFLVPAAQPDKLLGGLTQQQLKDWYKRNGFEDRVDYMIRMPKGNVSRSNVENSVQAALANADNDVNKAIEFQQNRIAKLQKDAKLGPDNAPDFLYTAAQVGDKTAIEALSDPVKYKKYFDNLLSTQTKALEQLNKGNVSRSLAPPGIEPNKGFYDSLVKETNKNTYNAEKMLADVSKYEGNTEIGRVARMLLNSSVIPKYELQNIHVTRGAQGGSYYANFFEDGKRRSFISMGREHVAHPETGLHEIVHGLAVSQVTRVQNPRYISTGAEWETAANNLINLYRLVDRYYITDNINKPEPYGLTDVNEFISEAIVNEDFKNYLKSISIADMRKKLTSSEQTMFNKLIIGTKNMFQVFTKLLRKTLGLPDSSQTVFDLAIDNIGTLIAGTPGPLITKGTMRDMDSISRKVATPNKYGRDPVPADVIKILDSIKNNPALNVPVFKGKEDGVLAIKTGALPFLAVNQLRDIYSSNPRLTELKDYYESTQRMGGYRNMLREKYANALNDFHKVRKAYKGKPLLEQLDEVINEGSRLEVDVLKPSKDYTDPVAKADHARLQAMYDKFPEDVKAFYKKYRDTNGFVLDEIKKSMIARAQSYVTDPADKAEIKAMVEKKIDSFKEKGPYAPLMFFGNNWVTVQMAEDKVLPFSFETLSQAKEFAKEMKAKGYETKSFESIKELKAKGAPRAGFFKELEKVLDRNRVNPKAKDELYQMTLMYLPEESFMRQFQNRKGAPTYERDALRNYEELADRVVHQLPRARYMIDMDNAIEAMKNKVKQDPDDVSSRVVAEIEKHYDSTIQPKISPAATFLGNLGFAWYMGANPSAALVQLFQISGVTAPYLYPVYGVGKVNSELYQAARDFFGGKTEVGRGIFSIKNNPNLTATEKKAIQELYDLNVIPPAATEVGDIETMTGLKSSTPMERTLKKINMIMGYMFQNAERFNREVTALAAFRLEYNRSKDYAKAMKAANDTVVETQGDYSDVGTARVFKHPAAKVLLMFKKFMQMMIYMYSRNLQIMMQKGFTPEEKRIARNRLTGLLAASAMTSGVTGMPFYWIVETIMNAIGDDDDPYYDFTTSLRETMPEFIVSGFPSALTQGNIASRTGFRDMPLIGFMPGIGSGASRSEDAEGVIMDALKVATGPVGGLFLNIGRGVDQINDGKVYRGLETMAPSQIKNFMKSYRFIDEGAATTLRGDPIKEVTTYDAAMQALGFAPLPVATQQEENMRKLKVQTEAIRSKERVYAMLNLAQDANDSEGFDDAMKLVDKHNDRHPGTPITTDQILSSLEKHAKRSAEMLNGVYIEKGLRPYLNKVAD